MSADSVDRRFLQTVVPLIRSSDRPKLIAVLGSEWPSEGLVQFLRSSRGDVVKTAAVCLGLVGTTRHCRPLAAVLHHGDRQAVRFAERGLWSIWMKAGSRPGRRQLARASRMIQQEELESSVAELREQKAVEAPLAGSVPQPGLAESQPDRPLAPAAAVADLPPHSKGQGIFAYVTLKAGEAPGDYLRKDLVQWVRKEIGPIASPDRIQFAPGLPKTRSGKIMRRILRKIAEDDFGNLGDTSTLAEPAVVDDLIENRMNRAKA